MKTKWIRGKGINPRLARSKMNCKISKELAEFLGVSQNSIISRVKITKMIDSYIETNGLRDNRTIKPDEKLKKLLNCGDNEVTFANLQSYIAPHILLEPTNIPPIPPPPSAPPLSPECAYAVFPEDEFPEPPLPPEPLFPAVASSCVSVSVYAVFPEDELPDTLPHQPMYFNHALFHAVGIKRHVSTWTWDTSRYHIYAHRQLPSPRLPDKKSSERAYILGHLGLS